ncbi:MAG: calcium-binding protein, partial [Bacillota bacterium]
ELYGGDDNDILEGGAGYNYLEGGAGDDSLYGGIGDDSLYGDDGHDILDGGGAGYNYLEGGLGNDRLYGGIDDDELYGDDGDDVLEGGAGDDYLEGGSGNDYLSGGIGNDGYSFYMGDGQDIIYDYDATPDNKDAVYLDQSYIDLMFERDGNSLTISFGATTDILTINSWYSGSEYQIEELISADGSVLLNTQVEQLIQSMASFAQQNGVSWEVARQERTEDVQSLLSQFWISQGPQGPN